MRWWSLPICVSPSIPRLSFWSALSSLVHSQSGTHGTNTYFSAFSCVPSSARKRMRSSQATSEPCSRQALESSSGSTLLHHNGSRHRQCRNKAFRHSSLIYCWDLPHSLPLRLRTYHQGLHPGYPARSQQRREHAGHATLAEHPCHQANFRGLSSLGQFCPGDAECSPGHLRRTRRRQHLYRLVGCVGWTTARSRMTCFRY